MGYEKQVGRNVVSQRVDGYRFGLQFGRQRFDRRAAELPLIENPGNSGVSGFVYERPDMVSGGLLAFVLDGQLSQTVIAGHVGKGRMVNDEGAGTVGEYRLQCVVERIHAKRS